jgi:hypothetical protein
MKDRHLALAQLQQIHGELLCTRVFTPRLGLSDTHAARAHHLAYKSAAALTVVGRLLEGEAQ